MTGGAGGGIHLERTGPGGVVARVTINRPEVRNALDAAAIRALRDAFRAFATEPPERLRAVLLAGAGPAFCAGADLAWMRAATEATPDQNLADALVLAQLYRAIDECPVPVVARVQGAALGGGAGLCAAADVVIAEAGARLGFPEVRIGLLPATIAPFVVRRLGEGPARALFLTGRRLDAAEALRWGLVHQVISGEPALDAAVEAAVDDLLAAGPQAARAVKQMLRDLRGLGDADATLHTARLLAERRMGAEAAEGLRAAAERRRPDWAPEPPG